MDHLSKLLIAIISFGMQIKKDLADGKISRTEAFGLAMDAVRAAWDPIFNWQEIKAAVISLRTDPAARDNLTELIKGEFDLPDEELEQRIEEGINLLNMIVDYIFTWIPEGEGE